VFLEQQKGKKMSTAVVAKQNKFSGWLDNPTIQNRVSKALSGWIDEEEFVSQFAIACMKPELEGCTDISKFKAAHVCAALNLLPTLGHVALIPREIRDNGKPTGVFEMDVMPQWQGLKAVMERHPNVFYIEHELVFVGENYKRHSDGSFGHDFDPFVDREVEQDLSNLKGGYLRITYRDGRPQKFHFVTLETIKKAKACAQTAKVWNKWPKEQAIKTLWRNGYARRVVTIDAGVNRDLQTLIEAEDKALGNDPNRVQFGDVKKLIATTSGSRKERKRQEAEPAEPAEPAAAATEAAEEVDAVSHQTPAVVSHLQEFREFVSDATDPAEVDSILNAAIAKEPDLEKELCEIAVPLRDALETKQSAEGGNLFETKDDVGQ